MADSTHGRLFTLEDLRNVLACSRLFGLRELNAEDLIEHMEGFRGDQFAFPADEPMYVLRASEPGAPSALTTSLICFADIDEHEAIKSCAQAMREWHAANPRMKATGPVCEHCADEGTICEPDGSKSQPCPYCSVPDTEEGSNR
jgi:hypothetical protein